ncbi:MAG TPA: 2-C-methyl-D-erythritol 2,4-cyclodiphosphate synthase [Bryobacteraceae bacterium]|nr:2-C-methyl-D-erythritol 2,4-cyclodiphosphate synthase [Bryobacteraceae bacterium]
MSNFRIGLGYDLHRTLAGRPLVLANIVIPHDKGLDGHSDADVVIHALIDAIPGAAGLPDVGQLFPNTDPRYKNIDSAELLNATMREFARTGWRIVNTDIVILAQRPRLSPHKPAMVRRLAELLGVRQDQVNIKGKTGEGVDAVGEERAIACHCVVLLEQTAELAGGGEGAER